MRALQCLTVTHTHTHHIKLLDISSHIFSPSLRDGQSLSSISHLSESIMWCSSESLHSCEPLTHSRHDEFWAHYTHTHTPDAYYTLTPQNSKNRSYCQNTVYFWRLQLIRTVHQAYKTPTKDMNNENNANNPNPNPWVIHLEENSIQIMLCWNSPPVAGEDNSNIEMALIA